MVERPAGRSMLIRYTAMDAIAFDPNNPWHITLNIVYSLSCNRCTEMIAVDWTEDNDPERCILLTAERAQRAGWILRGEDRFFCPACAAQDRAV
jgi:hypothetical protein